MVRLFIGEMDAQVAQGIGNSSPIGVITFHFAVPLQSGQGMVSDVVEVLAA